MFARGLSGCHNTSAVGGPTDCVLPPRALVHAQPFGIFVRWMGKRVILLLSWPSERRRSPPVFNGLSWRQCARRFPKEILSVCQTQHFNYYHPPPSVWADLHRLTQIENMLEEKRERRKTTRDGVGPCGYYRDMNKRVRFELCGQGRKT